MQHRMHSEIHRNTPNLLQIAHESEHFKGVRDLDDSKVRCHSCSDEEIGDMRRMDYYEVVRKVVVSHLDLAGQGPEAAERMGKLIVFVTALFLFFEQDHRTYDCDRKVDEEFHSALDQWYSSIDESHMTLIPLWRLPTDYS